MRDVTETATLIFFFCLFVTGWCLSIAVLYSLYSDNKSGFKNNYDSICFYLVATELIWATLMLIDQLWILIINGLVDPSNPVCYVSAASVWLGVASLTAIHAVMAFDRLYNMVTLKPMSRSQLITVFASFFFVDMAIFVYAMSLPDPIAIWSTGTFCFVPVNVGDVHRQNPFLWEAGYFGLWLLIVTSIYAYLTWIVFYRAKQTNAVIHNEKAEKQQKQALMRCLLILCTLLITFGPTVVLFVINLFVDVPKNFYHISLGIQIMDGFLTPSLIIYLKAKNWEAFKKHVLGWPLSQTETLPTSKEKPTVQKAKHDSDIE